MRSYILPAIGIVCLSACAHTQKPPPPTGNTIVKGGSAFPEFTVNVGNLSSEMGSGYPFIYSVNLQGAENTFAAMDVSFKPSKKYLAFFDKDHSDSEPQIHIHIKNYSRALTLDCSVSAKKVDAQWNYYTQDGRTISGDTAKTIQWPNRNKDRVVMTSQRPSGAKAIGQHFVIRLLENKEMSWGGCTISPA